MTEVKEKLLEYKALLLDTYVHANLRIIITGENFLHNRETFHVIQNSIRLSHAIDTYHLLETCVYKQLYFNARTMSWFMYFSAYS